MINLPSRINPADPATHEEIKVYTIIQILMMIEQHNAAEAAYNTARAAADNVFAPYQTPEGRRIPQNAPPLVRELAYLLGLPHFNPKPCRWPASRSYAMVSISVAHWRQTTIQMQTIAVRLNGIVAALEAAKS